MVSDILMAIQGYMLDQGISRAVLADRLGVSRGTVSNFFNRDRSDMRIRDLARYLDALGLKITITVKER